MYAPVLVTPASGDVVSLDECKRHLGITWNDQDPLLQTYIDAAVGHLDGPRGWLGRALLTQVWSLQFDRFSWDMNLMPAPVSDIVSVTYVDDLGAGQSTASTWYTLLNAGDAPIVRFVDDYVFPTLNDDLPPITITIEAGYGDAAAVPSAIKVAIMMMVSDMLQNRDASVAGGMTDNPMVRRLLDPYRTRWAA